MNLNWAECIRVSDNWFNSYLNFHGNHNSNKVNIKSYSLKFSGTQYQIMGFVDSIVDHIKHFVLSPDDIKKLEAEGVDIFRRAMHYFGDTNPDNDGKYGELLLYLFTETVLKAPMIAHKMVLLTNTRDQVKGGDGIFFGEYNGNNSLFIGESKIEINVTTAISHALESIDRFHSNLETTLQFKHELIVASQILRQDLSQEMLDYLYDSFTPQTDIYKSNNITHPILIVYEDKQINDIEILCKNNSHGDQLLDKRMASRIPELLKNINSKLSKHKKVQSVYLEFFFLPASDVSAFRHTMYQAIHAVPYIRPVLKKVTKKKKGSKVNVSK